ncbi:MAG: hypothetical protein ACTSYA_01220 [Candidatus Kariarchaeaceae archaeon]
MAKLGMIFSSVLVGLGLILFIAGPVANVMVMSAVDDGIDDAVRKDASFFTNTDDEDFADWLSNHDADDAPKYYKYYLWNMTNVLEIKANTTQTPVYEEVGPYVYQKYEDIDPATIVYDDTDGTVYYGKDTYLKYVATESGAGLNHTGDLIYNFNPAYLSIVATAGSEQNFFVGNAHTTLNTTLFTALAGLKAINPAFTIGEVAAHWGNNSLTGLGVPSDVWCAANAAWNVGVGGLPLNLSAAASYAWLYDAGAYSLTSQTGMVAIYTAAGAYAATADAQYIIDYATAVGVATLGAVQLDAIKFTIMMAYLQGFIEPSFLAALEGYGSSYIPARTADDWLFNFIDPVIYSATGDLEAASRGYFTNVTTSNSDNVTKYVNPDDIKKLNYEIQTDGIDTIPLWSEVIHPNGTGATAWYPGVDEDDVLVAWNTDLMRNLDFVYSEDYEIYGVDTLKFVLSDEVLAIDSFYHQYFKGLGNMTAAAGAPIFLSKPHFGECGTGLLGTALELDTFDLDDHDTWVAVEPLTGAVLEGHKRLQVNFIAPTTDKLLADIQVDFRPLVWAEEAAKMTEQNAEDFKDKIYSAMDLADTLKITGLGAGLVLVGIGAVVYALVVRKSSA